MTSDFWSKLLGNVEHGSASSVLCALSSEDSAVCSVWGALRSVQHAVQCALCSVQFSVSFVVCSVHLAVCSHLVEDCRWVTLVCSAFISCSTYAEWK